jgi:hypothetical protein
MNPEAEHGTGGGKARPALILSMLALGIYFAASSWRGLYAYFTLDDGGNIANMHRYWVNSLWDLLGAALCVVTRMYRPLGGLYYFVLYKLAGFNPLPFRAVCLVLMLVNLLLAFWLFRRLSGSLGAGLLGAVLVANHPAVLSLVYSSGTIYEILCFLFYFLALGCYFVWRQEGRRTGADTLSWRQLAVLLALTGCALDSKEMAMTLPAALLLIELVYFPPDSRSWPALARYAVRQGRGALVTAALVVPVSAVKVLTENPLTYDPTYSGHSLRGAIEGMRAYHNFLLYGDLYVFTFSTAQLFLLWAGMALAAVLLRSRPMKFGLCFLIVSLIPVCLIARRGGYMLYLPLMGWGLYVGSLFQKLSDAAIRAIRLPLRAGEAARIAIFATAAVWIVNVHAARLAGSAAAIRREQSDMRRLIDSLRRAHPQLPRGASLLLLDDPLPKGHEVLLFSILAYNDPTLKVDRVKMLDRPPGKDALLRYDHVLAGGLDLHDVSIGTGARPAAGR